MLSALPQEVLFDIFLKLPMKTLLVCSCVSKSWHSLITSPAFISAHLRQTKNNDTRLLLVRRCYGTGHKLEERYSIHLDSETFDVLQELKFPFVNLHENTKIVGFCNGLLCLAGLNIILWNPSIRRFAVVPWSSDIFTTYGTSYKFALGFGFDSRSTDFKVVRLVYLEGETFYDYVVPPKVEVYELSTGCWRGIHCTAPPYEIIKSQWTQAFLNGAIHWIAFRRGHRGFRCLILRFHMAEESFSTMALPECLENESPENLKVAVLGGALSVLQCGWYLFGNRYVSSVWTMRKYHEPDSWSKLVSVDRSNGFGMIVGCRENGEVLMTSRTGELVLYKPENQQVRALGIRGSGESFYLDYYVESLALMREGRGIRKEARGLPSDGEEE